MFDEIFTFFVNIIGDSFHKELLNKKEAVKFLVGINSILLVVVFVLNLTIKERLAILIAPNIMFFLIRIILKKLYKYN